MAKYEHLEIYRKAFDLLLYIEKIVRNFSRYNKYTHGTELRNLAGVIMSMIIKANNTRREDRLPVLREMAVKIEELKVRMRICKEIKAFHNFNSFETGVNHIISLARQNEGWMRGLKAREEGKWSESRSSEKGVRE